MKSTDFTDSTNFEQLISSYLERFCKATRVEHSISVAVMASKLCARFGEDPERGFAAGLAHDLMKDRPLDLQWEYARRAGRYATLQGVADVVSRMEGEKAFSEKIIHGPAASVFLFEECGLKNVDMLEAVALHSSASKTMSKLAKIVFIADKMEPKRPYITQTEIAATASFDLDQLLIKALDLSIGWLKRKNHAIAQSTLDLYNALTMREKTR